MVLTGYKRPLVQEDLWDLNEEDTTRHISEQFEFHMNNELAAAQASYQKRLRKKHDRGKAQDEALQNGLSNGLGKGVSRDVLMMVSLSHVHDRTWSGLLITIQPTFVTLSLTPVFSIGGEG